MKRLLISLTVALYALAAGATELADLMPSWARHTPNPPADVNYFLSWGVGEGQTEQEAQNAAWTDALNRSFHELRVAGISKQDINSVTTKGIDGVVSFHKVKRRVVAESAPIIVANGVKIFILIQVQRNVNGPDDFYDLNTKKFDDHSFNLAVADYNAQFTGRYPFSARVFVPGMAQLHKGSVAKGAIIIGAETACVAGIIATECMRASYASKVNSTHNATHKRTYQNKASNCQNARNILIGAAVAVYAWNVIDGAVARGAKRSPEMALGPCVIDDGMGLAMTIKF